MLFISIKIISKLRTDINPLSRDNEVDIQILGGQLSIRLRFIGQLSQFDNGDAKLKTEERHNYIPTQTLIEQHI